MKTKDFIVCAIFVAGAAVMYGTQETCDALAKELSGASVREVTSFNELR